MLSNFECVLDRLEVTSRNGSKAKAFCPAHDDGNNPSLSVGVGENDKVLLKCFAGCAVEDVIAAIGLDMSDLFGDRNGKGGGGEPNPTGNARYVDTSGGCTLHEYSEHKGLPVEFLRKQNVSEIPNYNGGPAVKMDYLDVDGSEGLSVRFRISLTGKPKIKTRRGDKLYLYGLWRLQEARDAGYAVVVEGESDAQTGWFHGVPTIAVPGASSWRDEWAAELDGIEKIYAFVEPDQGGHNLWAKLAASPLRDRLYRVKLECFKDLSEMHLNDPERFKKRLTTALDNAEPWHEIAEAESMERVREAWVKCKELALKHRILDEFEKDLKASGVAGDTRNGKLIFLALITRLMGAKLLVNVIVKGPSSAGKSFLVRKVLGFFPDEAYYVLTAMSERALAYDDEPISNRFLVIAEATGLKGEILEYLVRSLLSEGEINYVTVVKGPEGPKPMRIHRKGPTGLISTTTRVRVHHENETRVFSVQVDDSPDLTKEILKTIAKEDTEPPDMGRWHALQEWLAAGETRVVIPYSEALAEKVPPAAVRLRRDFASVLNLIRAHALLHRAKRERDAKGRIVATLEDYDVVREIVSKTISEGVEVSVPEIVRTTVQAVKDLGGDSEDTAVTIKAVGKKLRLDYSATHRRVNLAQDGGYLKNLEDRPNRPAKLVLGDHLPKDQHILPDSKELRREAEEFSVSTHLTDSEGKDPLLPPSFEPVREAYDRAVEATQRPFEADLNDPGIDF